MTTASHTHFELDPEEQVLLASFEAGDWQRINDAPTANAYQQSAKLALAKNRRINIRLSTMDLEGMQAKAAEQGLPYQTLIASVLHQYAAGRLVAKA